MANRKQYMKTLSPSGGSNTQRHSRSFIFKSCVGLNHTTVWYVADVVSPPAVVRTYLVIQPVWGAAKFRPAAGRQTGLT